VSWVKAEMNEGGQTDALKLPSGSGMAAGVGGGAVATSLDLA
jgi:hypothetical protein